MARRPIGVILGVALAIGVASDRPHAQATGDQGLVAGRNVNMVAGTTWPTGDPFLQRQNEPSGAASTRNPLHLLGGANDYRTIDLPGLPEGEETGDAWLGLFKSLDGGQRWQSNLVPGYPQDASPEGLASPLKVRKSHPALASFDLGYEAGADPVVRAGTHGLFYYSGLAFMRGANGRSAVFVARYIDNNNREGGDPIAYLGTSIIAKDSGVTGRFLDKPWLAVDLPRFGARTCHIVTPGEHGLVTQDIPAGVAYAAFSAITGEGATLRSQILFSYSTDCGATWSPPVRISRREDQVNQGASIAIDPRTGDVYIAWRRFSVSATDDGDAIMVARSATFGRKFDPPCVVRRFPRGLMIGRFFERFLEHRRPKQAIEAAELAEFDQGSSALDLSFRTNAYPSLTFDDHSRAYLAWSERGFASLRPDPVGGDARVLVSTSRNGVMWTPPHVLEDSPEPGHQIMPTIAFAGGKLVVVYYDLREDRSHVFAKFVDDKTAIAAANRRHTIDIRAAVAMPAARPIFQPSIRVSDYLMGFRSPTGPFEQLQVNPPNLPMFSQGRLPFVGDYIDVAPAPPFVPAGHGRWKYNTGGTPIFHAVWTDNRDVRPPAVDTNGDGNPWNDYTPPTYLPGISPFDPTRPVPACVPGNAGSRNQNIYTARLTLGLLVGSPGNAKPLSGDLQRGFVVFAHNTTFQTRSFRLTILSQPPGGRASFEQFPLPPYGPGAPPPLTAIDVTTPPRSVASRTVYVTSSDPHAHVTVAVAEIAAPGAPPVPGGLGGTILLNPDIENPDIENPDIENREVATPDIENPDIENAAVQNPAIENPDIENPDIENVNVANPDIENPDIENPDIENPDIENPDIENPDIENPDIENGTVSDVSWTITNTGNTTSAYNVNLFLNSSSVPGGIKTQLILRKIYKTPVTLSCDLKLEPRNVLITNIPNPTFIGPTTPDLGDPNDPSGKNATLWLAPGEQARITLRVIDPDTSNNVIVNGASIDPAFVPTEEVTPLVQQQAVNTDDAREGVTEPPVVTPTGSTIFFVQQPTSTPAGETVVPPVRVQVRDTTGAVLPGVAVTLALSANPGGATLFGGGPVVTDATGIAMFPSIRLSASGVGYRLRASAALPGLVPVDSAPFDSLWPAPSQGQVTDPVGDAWPGGNPSPDLVSATITQGNGVLTMSVRFAPGTFNASTTLAQFLLDTDQNPATGHPGVNSLCVDDAGVIGNEYLVNIQSGSAVVYKYAGTCNSFTVIATLSASAVTDGYDVTVPLSLLGGDDGLLDFKLTVAAEISPGGYTGVLDVMPNVGLPPGRTSGD